MEVKVIGGGGVTAAGVGGVTAAKGPIIHHPSFALAWMLPRMQRGGAPTAPASGEQRCC